MHAVELSLPVGHGQSSFAAFLADGFACVVLRSFDQPPAEILASCSCVSFVFLLVSAGYLTKSLDNSDVAVR